MNVFQSQARLVVYELNAVSVSTRARVKRAIIASFIYSNKYLNVSGKFQGPPSEVTQLQTFNDAKGKVRASGIGYSAPSWFKSGACFYLHALNIEAHECLSKPGVHRSFVLHRIRTEKRSINGWVHPSKGKVEAPVGRVKHVHWDEWIKPVHSKGSAHQASGECDFILQMR